MPRFAFIAMFSLHLKKNRDMKINTLRIFAAVAALVVLTGCDPAYRMTKCPSYVVCYVNLKTINLSVEPSDPRCVLINHGNDLPIIAYGLNSTGAEKEKYDQLCKKHKDLSYNRYRMLSYNPSIDFASVTYNECDFTEITVTADKDFDETHPAGTDLSDIVRFMSWSPYKYILSGYSKYYHYDKSDVSTAFDSMMRRYINNKYFDKETDAECYPIDKLIRDLTADDLILVGHGAPGFLGMLYFDKLPTGEGEYEVAVTIRTDDNRTLSNTVKMQFL